ncbi:hypothetical protein B7C62_21015 [Kitasatospora albolonga]|uniref:Uncharacterized protein n=1 Tax=Kitasatospora albolonga TaxID=68173 RepID=A0ABC8BW83_9ACTN|nr:hypothetical protein B7C62_21015 [Kitasatospora albolonga]
MNPRTYDILYRPARIAPPPRRTPVMLLAAGLWLLAWVLISLPVALAGLTVVWGMAEGVPMTGFLLWCVGGASAGTAVLVAVRLAPAVRRMRADARSLLLAALACLVSLVLAAVTWLSAV